MNMETREQRLAAFRKEMGEEFFLVLGKRISEGLKEVDDSIIRRRAYLGRAHEMNRKLRVTI